MIVCSPFAPLFKEPDFMSEQVDEVIFGDGAEISAEEKNFWQIKTDYGYCGWILKENLFKKFFDCNYSVISPFADLLFEGRNRLRPAFTLPKGAKINVRFPKEESRFAYVTLPNGQIYYIHKNHISPISNEKKGEERLRKSIVSTAKDYLGVQYRWGGRTFEGIDCSGLCFNAYRFNGIGIWRDAVIEKSPDLRKIPFEELKEGDLLFFKGHVAMWLGNGEIIHSAASKGKVVIEKFQENQNLKEIYICAGTPF